MRILAALHPQQCLLWSFFYWSHSNRCVVRFHCGLVCILLMTNEDEYWAFFCVCIFPLYVFSGGVSVQIFSHFLEKQVGGGKKTFGNHQSSHQIHQGAKESWWTCCDPFSGSQTLKVKQRAEMRPDSGLVWVSRGEGRRGPRSMSFVLLDLICTVGSPLLPSLLGRSVFSAGD